LELKEKDSKKAKEIDFFDISLETAMTLSEKYDIPLHPFFIPYWTQISKEALVGLLEWIKFSKINRKLIFPYTRSDKERFALGKRALELIGIEHEVTIENVVLSEEDSKILFVNLGLDLSLFEKEDIFLSSFVDISKYNLDSSVLDIINLFSKFKIKDKAGEFIGSRMGRPEKAKLRKLVGSPNVLFPVGKEGGRLRSIQAACEVGHVRSDFPLYFCEKCEKETIYPLCEFCGSKCKKKFYFFDTGEISSTKKSLDSEKEGTPYKNRSIDISYYLANAKAFLKMGDSEMPLLIKAIRGTSSGDHSMESLCKGILRAKYNLQVNKDGTIRFDATELPIVSFKPKEISTSVEKLRALGYDKDIDGKDLVDENQIIEIMPHDVLLPSYQETPDEKADDVFIRVCNFIDELLVKFYKLEPFYKVSKREDLIGKIGVCMAPHNCAGVVCRFIGFSNTLGLFASPYMHAAIRRDCDGDEAAIMLLGDVLLNFSRKFLPGHRGGTQDAPLVLNVKIDAGEVDDQILDFEFLREYPLELYKCAEKGEHSSLVKVNTVKKILKEGKDPFINVGFTHNTSNFNEGVACSSYKLLATMQEKVDHQMILVEKIRAADTSDTARLIIDRHFLRDIKGNLRKFSTQSFRCVECNESIRRPPLSGLCPRCKKGKIIFTIHEGGIKKYLEIAISLANKYALSSYMKQNLELTKRYIDSVFGKEPEKQEALAKWF
jgi:DNA polymerase II large subunit